MKLSIITINYNNASDLDKTIQSVINQSFQDFEFIIIDGGSTDRSIEIIKQHQQRLAYWVSERDNGVYHAMNKGIERAKGEYLLMLNAGDLLLDNQVLGKVFELNSYSEDLIAGDVYRTVSEKIIDKSHFPDRLTFGFLRSGTLSHQATFIKRALHEVVGFYDENLKYSADWKFFILAICKFNVTYRHVPIYIAQCDCTGLTNRSENFAEMKLESEQVLLEYFPAFLKDYHALDMYKSRTLKRRFSALNKGIKKSVKKIVSIIGVKPKITSPHL